LAIYPTAWWRSKGYSGQVLADIGPAHVTFDASDPSGTPGQLMGFVEGRAARELAQVSEEQRKQKILACFATHFGQEALYPSHYLDKSWADDEWSRGCYVGNMAPGCWRDFGPHLRKPVGRIHWAGTETATVWNGYIDGAIQAGERAAQELLEAKT